MAALPVRQQVSAGGVAYRTQDGRVEVALIGVGQNLRWQLPKGLVDPGETPEQAAVREVREETGLVTELVQLLDKIEYWYIATEKGGKVRIHKFVHFYLLRYLSGDVADHDYEVEEARWVEIDEAIKQLAFDSERQLVEKARTLLMA
jgi:mutator protein MutT